MSLFHPRAWCRVPVLVLGLVALVVFGASCRQQTRGAPTTGFTDSSTTETPPSSSSTAGTVPPTTTRSTVPSEWVPLATLPVGADGVGYEDVGVPEMLPWGPTALSIDPDGDFWVVDLAGGSLVEVSAAGVMVRRVDLTPLGVASVLDAAAGPAGISLLDINTVTGRHRVVTVATDGTPVGEVDLPAGMRLEDGLSGIALSPSGRLWVELDGGVRVAELTALDGTPEVTWFDGYPYPQGLYSIVPSPWTARLFHTPDTEITVTAAHPVGTLQLVGVNSDGSFVLDVAESTQDATGRTLVDQTIRRYTVDGRLTGQGRFPLADQIVYVEHPLALGPDGNVYGLLTHPDHVVIAHITYSTHLTPILP